jgi:7-carboxy-7-deazaguanine synthase
MQLNMQPVEKQVAAEDGTMNVHSIFDTIQGEGPYVGTPCVFIRLAGCNLQCPMCDTDYTTGRRIMGVDAILDEVRSYRRGGLVVITGGEPFRQANGRLVRKLALAGYHAQFETNGTLFDETMVDQFQRATVVCSPKTPVISRDLAPHINYFKYIVNAGRVDDKDGLPLHSLGMSGKPYRPDALFNREHIFVQPCDAKDARENAENVRQAVASCRKFGYRLCLQLHKEINLP